MQHTAAATLLFRRDFRAFSGGHLKVWDYFCHTRHSARYQPRVFLTEGSLRDAPNPWHGIEPPPLERWAPEAADALFVAGLDWRDVPTTTRIPVVNLVQHVRHAVPGDPRRQFLSRRAVRICVSEEVAEAIRGTGEVNGPILTIPNGIDVGMLPTPAALRDIRVLVAGMKDPDLARAVAARWPGETVCQTERLPRREFLELLGRARIAVVIPHREEGFFLPALEAMAMGCLVVCPDCVGNRSFCRDGENCLRPQRSPDAIMAAVGRMRAASAAATSSMLAAAEAVVHEHDLLRERDAYLAILDGLPELA